MNLGDVKIGDCVKHADFSISPEYEKGEPFTIIATLCFGRVVEIHPPTFDVQPLPATQPNTLNATVSMTEARITIETPTGHRATVDLNGTQKISLLELLAIASY
jgi:hypothetical protein